LGAEELIGITTKDLLLHNLGCKSRGEQIPDRQTKNAASLAHVTEVGELAVVAIFKETTHNLAGLQSSSEQ
jgi:hypothetical protein